MRLTPRLGIRILLVLVAIAILSLRLVPRFLPHRSAAAGDLSATSPLNQPGGGPAPAAAYPIYSALYQPAALAASQTQANEPLAIAAASQTDIPQVGASCLKPSTPDEHEMTDVFDAANQQSHSWAPQFSIPQGYRLLSPQQTAQAQQCLATHDQTSAQCSPYAQIRHIRYLGVPGPDRSGTHALVSVIKSCGSHCGSGGIFEVEKSGSAWQRVPASDFTSDCSWVY